MENSFPRGRRPWALAIGLLAAWGCAGSGDNLNYDPPVREAEKSLESADSKDKPYLYGMAAVCFLGGIVMAGRGFSALSRVIAERP